MFVAFLYKEGLAAGTVKSYLAAIQHAQIGAGLGDPKIANMPKLEYVTKGMRHKMPGKGRRPRLQITPEVLKKLKASWEKLASREDAVILWGASCLCFFGFPRMGEAVVPSDTQYDLEIHLSYRDIKVNSRSHPQWLEVHIKASKNDPFRHGVSIYCMWGPQEVHCAQWLLCWLIWCNRAQEKGRYSGLEMANTSLEPVLSQHSDVLYRKPALLQRAIQGTILELEQQPQHHSAVCMTR